MILIPNTPMINATIVAWTSCILATLFRRLVYLLSLAISLNLILWSAGTAAYRRYFLLFFSFFSTTDVWFGDFKDAVSFDVEIPQVLSRFQSPSLACGANIFHQLQVHTAYRGTNVNGLTYGGACIQSVQSFNKR